MSDISNIDVITALNLDHQSYSLSDGIPNSLAKMIVRAGKHKACKSIQLNGAGATTANLFSFTEEVFITRLYGVCTAAEDVTSCTGFSFQAYDGTNTLQLTKNDGVLTNLGVGSSVIKNAASATTVATLNSDQVRIDETLASIFSQFALSPKNGVTNYIRIAYTGATDYDCTWKFCIEWTPYSSDSELEPV